MRRPDNRISRQGVERVSKPLILRRSNILQRKMWRKSDLTEGLHASSSATRDPNSVAIGNADLIGKRRTRAIPIPPMGVLDDYVSLYARESEIEVGRIRPHAQLRERASARSTRRVARSAPFGGIKHSSNQTYKEQAGCGVMGFYTRTNVRLCRELIAAGTGVAGSTLPAKLQYDGSRAAVRQCLRLEDVIRAQRLTSRHRAHALAARYTEVAVAFDADSGIDDELTRPRLDRAHRALILARRAVDALAGDHVRHIQCTLVENTPIKPARRTLSSTIAASVVYSPSCSMRLK